MRILTLNCGSSTLKFDIFDVQPGSDTPERFAGGKVERIGHNGRVVFDNDDAGIEFDITTSSHQDAFEAVHRLLHDAGYIEGIEAIGHRVVHGGVRFSSPSRLDPEVIEAIRAVSDLAPLHNAPALAVIDAATNSFGTGVPMVAAFDTAYFASLPESARLYAIPKTLSERYGIRRFGFHGLAHAHMVQRYRALRPERERPRLITLQLGSGCSACASVDGMPLDTSMGYTPLEGLIMGSRSGDIDPTLPLRLQTLTGRTAGEIEDLLNTESGLIGLAGTAEMRDLIPRAEDGDSDAALALDAFCSRIKKYVGAYLAVLGGADAVIFGGGIGENVPEIRRRVCAGMDWCGISLDNDVNEAPAGAEALLSAPHSTVEVWKVSVDEATAIALATFETLRSSA